MALRSRSFWWVFDGIFGRTKLPSLAREGAKREPDRAKHKEMLRPTRKCREASLAGADGVVGSSLRLSVVEQTTPAAPSEERDHFFGGAATPPWPSNGIRLRKLAHSFKDAPFV